MATALDIIKRSLRLLGVSAQGETPGANESKEALIALNAMIESWSNESLMLYTVTNNLFTVTAGTASYTIGSPSSGAVWESGCVFRPGILSDPSAFVRQGETDYPVEYYSNDRFQIIANKVEAGFPNKWTCDWEYPIATIRIYPVPSESGLQFGISELNQLTKFATLSDVLVLPNGYQDALAYNLAVALAPEYGLEASATVVDRANTSKFNIKRINSEPVLLEADEALLRNSNYSIYSDSYL